MVGCDLIRRRKDADAVYLLGIARQVAPLDQLKASHCEFQKRMMSGALPEAAAPPIAQPSRESRPDRPILSSSRGLQIHVDPTSSSSQAREIQTNPWPDLGTRKGRIKENVPEVKKMAGSTIRQPGRSARIAAGTASGSSTASVIVPYRDPDPNDAKMLHPPTRTSKGAKGVPKTPGKAVEVFEDEEEPIAQVTCSPRFVPFRDEVRQSSSSTICN
jgi:hypothetical protein